MHVRVGRRACRYMLTRVREYLDVHVCRGRHMFKGFCHAFVHNQGAPTRMRCRPETHRRRCWHWLPHQSWSQQRMRPLGSLPRWRALVETRRPSAGDVAAASFISCAHTGVSFFLQQMCCNTCAGVACFELVCMMYVCMQMRIHAGISRLK